MATGTSARAVGLLFAVLAAGFFMGAAWDGESASATAVEPPAENARGESRSLVIDQVGLEDDQQQEVDLIVEYFQAQMRELNHEFRQAYRPRQSKLLAQTRDSIKAVLSPQQAITYDSLLEARYGDSVTDKGRRGTGRDRGDGRGK